MIESPEGNPIGGGNPQEHQNFDVTKSEEKVKPTDSRVAKMKDVLTDVTNQVKELLDSGKFNYDTYIELLIESFQGQDSGMVKPFVRDLLDDTENDATKPETWTQTNQFVDNVAERNPDYVPLLMDPCIVLRKGKFFTFINTNPNLPPVEARKKFIEDFFYDETFYRGFVLHEGEEIAENGNLAPTVRKASQGSGSDSLVNSVHRDNRHIKDKPGNEYRLRFPFLHSDFMEQALIHAAYQRHDQDFISVSGSPEASWLLEASSEKGKQDWKKWRPDKKLRIVKFKMSSFYALTIPELFKAQGKRLASGVVEATGGENTVTFDNQDPYINMLVPLSLPENFSSEHRDFKPTFNDGKPVRTFQIPTSEDFS